MKTKTTLLKTSFLALFLFISATAWSAVAPAPTAYYVCTGSTLSLTLPDAAPTGTHYSWDVKQGGTTIPGYPSTTAPTTLPGAGSYEIILNTVLDVASTAGICPPDPVFNTFIVLPNLAIELGTPTNPIYCAENNAIKTSDITQTTTGFPTTYSADLEAEYTYSVIKDAETTPVDGTTLGTINPTTGQYTLTTLVPGTYKITGHVKYKQKTTATGVLLGSTGCEVASTTTVQTITVTPEPEKPVITISAS